MSNKIFLRKLGFFPKNNASEVFYKIYKSAGSYCIEVDLENEMFDFGSKIRAESGTALNFSKEENWVVFECVDRLLGKGYQPEDIILEKTWKVGHGASGGRSDILVEKNKKAYLMIECKTWESEFEKELKKIQKDGGQLFTYFQQDNKTEYLMLYTSQFDGEEINFKNEIIKIEEYYRDAGNVKDFYDRWNKITKQNGIFDDWVNAYEFKSKALTRKDLKPLEKEDSVSLFNKFEAILRKHTVSDGPNAFNKIFNLFLSKIFDEKKRDTDELDFQWKEGIDDNVDFQVRLINLYKEGIWEFLRKEIEGIKDSDFTYDTKEELKERKKKILKFNKIFDIKEVFDDETFEDNARVLKEIVELLSEYKVRYPRKQQHLSDFFERLLTTGLKQKAGQFFTPPPIARFIIKSLPIKDTLLKKIEIGNSQDVLPAIIDYAAGSGHFLTESMEEIQKIIEEVKEDEYIESVAKQIKSWKINQFEWASKYIYGIEKDYRLVKVAKVGCYFYGDGLAQVIYGDGLDSFDSKSYRGLLNHRKGNQENQAFDFVISNPPYSVQRFRADIKNNAPEESFDLYNNFTDNSKEIECLFIERTKQLLKEESGIAGIILPSSILSNAGIYTKAREILLKYFKIIAITELGSGTFMATGTNTVILFLRRRANCEWENIKESIEIFFQNYRDITAGGIEHIFSKYVKQVWDTASFEDYVSFCKKMPNENIKKHNIFKEYEKKIKAKNDKEKQDKILEIEKEKLLYFILAYSQKVVVVKSGKKKEEKAFLGYEFSNRRGYEGIHAIQRSKTIDECTKMFDDPENENSEKANFYVYKAFAGEADLKISPALSNHVFYANLVDMIAFDRPDFEKAISLSLKTTSKIESKWEMVRLGEVVEYTQGLIYDKNDESGKATLKKILTASNIDLNNNILDLDKLRYLNDSVNIAPVFSLRKNDIFVCTSSGSKSHLGKNILIKKSYPNYYFGGFCAVLRSKGIIEQSIIHNILQSDEFRSYVEADGGQNINNLKRDYLLDFKIPLPPKEIQEKIAGELEKLEEKEDKISTQIFEFESKIKKSLKSSSKTIKTRIGDILTLKYGSALPERDRVSGEYPVMGSNGIVGYHNSYIVDGPSIIVGRKGSAGKVFWIDKSNFPIDTAFYVKKISEKIDYKFIFYILKDINLEKLALGAGVPGLNRNDVYNQNYDLPSLEEQQKIVSQIQKIEDQISELNEELREIKNQKTEVLKKYL